jgi:DNA polymerase-3 subunit delta'
MAWQGIVGHDHLVEQFRRAIARGRLASTFLFLGPAGIGKRAFAVKLAQTLLCSVRPPELMDPCGACPGCTQVLAGTHPDLTIVSKPVDKNEMPLELFIGSRDKRMQEGLCHTISLKPFMGGRRVAIIDDADTLNEEGANCLLKTLEEPPPQSTIILIGTSAEKQLPTIRSRCQIVRFRPLSAEEVEQLILAHGLFQDRTEAEVESAGQTSIGPIGPMRPTGDASFARRLAEFSEGSLERAGQLADEQLWQFRRQLLAGLANRRTNSVALAQAVIGFVDQAGKEASLRRDRMRQVIGFAADFYLHLMRTLSGAPLPADVDLRGPLSAAARDWPGDEQWAANCLSRCLEAQQHVDRYVNQSTLLECWIDDVFQIAAGRLRLSEV